MILSDGEIRKAIQSGEIEIDPPPTDDQFQPSALDLHLGNIFNEAEPGYTIKDIDRKYGMFSSTSYVSREHALKLAIEERQKALREHPELFSRT